MFIILVIRASIERNLRDWKADYWCCHRFALKPWIAHFKHFISCLSVKGMFVVFKLGIWSLNLQSSHFLICHVFTRGFEGAKSGNNTKSPSSPNAAVIFLRRWFCAGFQSVGNWRRTLQTKDIIPVWEFTHHWCSETLVSLCAQRCRKSLGPCLSQLPEPLQLEYSIVLAAFLGCETSLVTEKLFCLSQSLSKLSERVSKV